MQRPSRQLRRQRPPRQLPNPIPQRRGVKLVPNKETWTRPDGWVDPYPEAGRHVAKEVGRFSPSMDDYIKAVEWSKNGWLDCAGEYIDRVHIGAVGYAMSRQLRRSRSFIVNGCGFAWVDDLISIMYIEDQSYATAAQIYYVVAKDRTSRF